MVHSVYCFYYYYFTIIAVNVVRRCIHCQKLAPIWQQLAERFQNNEDVTVAAVDCSQQSSLCSKQGVSYSICNSYIHCFSLVLSFCEVNFH